MNKIDRYIKKLLKNADELKTVSEFFDPDQEITVTVHCLTYNQEQYISKCLDSMLQQKVNFNVEIIAHNDCSTDNTKEIIDNYAKKYPNAIIPFHEEKNVFSLTHSILDFSSSMCALSKGKYIAICEGDDYWTDPYKLFIQVNLMSKYGRCHLCVHKVDVTTDSNYKVVDKTLPKTNIPSCILNDLKFISIVNNRYSFQTSSYFFIKDDYNNLLSSRPGYSRIMPTDDEVLLRHFGSMGDTLYINRCMSVYQQFTDGSWSQQHVNDTVEKESKIKRYMDAVMSFNIYTNYKYKKSCEYAVNKQLVYKNLRKKNYLYIFSEKDLKKVLWKMDKKTFVALYLKHIFRCKKDN